MEITDEQKACKVIEVIVSDDFCEDIEFRIAMNRPVTLSQKDIALINKKPQELKGDSVKIRIIRSDEDRKSVV